MEQTTAVTKSNGQLPQWKPPTIAELTETLELKAKDDVLLMALNLEPPSSWIVEHPTIKIKVKNTTAEGVVIESTEKLRYIPIDKQRLLAKRFFGIVEVEIREVKQMFQSVVVAVRINYKHPITGEKLFMDGIGAVGVQTDAGASASDLSKIKHDAIMKAAPAAAAYAEKNAYDKMGRIFGGEIQKNAIRYDESFAAYAKEFYGAVSIDDLKELYEEKKDKLNKKEIADAERIINNQEVNSYGKLYKSLSK